MEGKTIVIGATSGIGIHRQGIENLSLKDMVIHYFYFQCS